MSNFKFWLVSLIIFSSSACAGWGEVFTGVGYEAGVLTHDRPVPQPVAEFASNDAFQASMLQHNLTIYSAEGVFNSAMGSGANEFEARNQAMESARSKAERGDYSSTEYSSEIVVMPGLKDYLRLSYGKTGSYTKGVGQTDTVEREINLTMLGVEVGAIFPMWTLNDQLAIDISLATRFSFWSSETEGSLDRADVDTFTAGIPIGLAVSYRVLDNLQLVLIPELDIPMLLVSGLLVLLDDSFPLFLQYGVRGMASYSVFDWLSIVAEAGLGRPDAGFDGENSTILSAKGGIVLSW